MQSENQTFGNEVISFNTVFELKNTFRLFDSQVIQYQKTLENQVTANKQYQQIVQNARMYISHFIQVFNLAVIRGDIKPEQKLLYQLDPEVHNVPDLNSDTALLHWGKCIIDGENERVRNGGVQIYNPTITKVKVHYEIFKEYNTNHKLYQNTTTRNRQELVALREKCDKLILDAWNQVEEKFKNEPPHLRLKKCQEFGLIYYYRKGEEKTTEN
ncbi:hypothetical protein [Paludibacter sp. 221]|uniref:hypothetical protein n=1 Tax=Paludibacter sp. 221 TaxID=2302939 RepID=UPI00351ADDC7